MKRWLIPLVVAGFLVNAGTAVAVGWYLGSLPLPINRPTQPVAVTSPWTGNALSVSYKPTPTPTRWFGNPAIWQPPDIPGARIEYFNVSGSTQTELIQSLDASGLKDSNGLTHWGQEHVQWGGGPCYSPRTALPYQDVVTLPRWTPIADGSVDQDLVVKWNALQEVIYVHEAGHVKISQDDLEYMRQLPSCQAAANYVNNTLPQKLNDDQNAYHARLKADCRPEIGCIPPGWLGW